MRKTTRNLGRFKIGQPGPPQFTRWQEDGGGKNYQLRKTIGNVGRGGTSTLKIQRYVLVGRTTSVTIQISISLTTSVTIQISIPLTISVSVSISI